jgi:xeroderma pigmentosum group C-complementing protein
LGVDYADAVTGFSFKGRHGTAIVQGVVVATEYAEAVQEVIDGMIYEQEEAANAARTRESLRLWRRFFLGLRIAQRVNAIEIDGEKGPSLDVQDEIDREDKQMIEAEMAGGFFPDEADFAQPTRRDHAPPQQDYGAGGFMPDDNGDEEAQGGFIPEPDDAAPRGGFMLNREHSFESSILDSQQLRPRRRSSFADDYVLEEEDDEAGGFIHDESPEAGPSTHALYDGEADQAGGFVAEDEDDVDMHAAIAASMQDQRQTSTSAASDQPSAAPVFEEVQADDPATTTDQDQSPESSPSDAGSLPLEDPEDEDADPDWLVDAT